MSSLDAPLASTEHSNSIDDAPPTTMRILEAPTESTARTTTTPVDSIVAINVAEDEPVETEGISSTHATPTSSGSASEVTATTSRYSTTSTISSEEPETPSSGPALVTTSPPPAEIPAPSASLSTPTLPSISIVSEVPLQTIAPVPEFLSFNEWKEKFVVVPDPSIALAKRAKKAAQRQRQDVVGAGSAGDKGSTYDGDGADLGSLFASGEDGTDSSSSSSTGADAAKRDEDRSHGIRQDDAARRRRDRGEPGPPPQSLSPIQPLANVGTGDDHDPLLALRDRSNYAAFECAAMVHRSSRKTKGASAILVEKKDRYMLTPCAADPKFVEVELCDEIQIDTIVLANFEFFSSMFKHFKASCSVNYPGAPDDWHDLGTFRARNMRGVQVFRPNLIPNFCRYIRINFLSHFGSEYYCPVSLLRVYGYTQLDAYRESERKARQLQEALAAAEEYVEEDEIEGSEPESNAVKEDIPAPIPPERDGVEEGHGVPAEDNKVAEGPGVGNTKPSNATQFEPRNSDPVPPRTSDAPPEVVQNSVSQFSPEKTNPEASPSTATTTLASTSTKGSSAAETPRTGIVDIDRPTESSSTPDVQRTPLADSHLSTLTKTASSPSPSSNKPSLTIPPVASVSPSNVSAPQIPSSSPSSNSSASSRTANPSDLPIINPRPLAARNETLPYAQPHRPPVISPPIQQPQPGESIYATIMKRLTSLEHNQTLSMHFIEAQSSMLREAFTRIERRLGEVEATRSRQEQGIKQALVDLEQERNNLQREKLGLSNQVGLLAQEIRLEKRLSAIQLVGTLLILVFVGFTRSIPTSPFLHLASSTNTKGRTSIKRGTDETDDHQVSTEERSSPDLPRKGLGRRSSGNAGTKHSSGHSKRFPSMSKPGPRRHYGTGTSSSTRTPALAKSPRAWTPPMRHSSAPPEEPPTGSISTALEGKEPRRRYGSNRRPGSPFEFPRRSKLETQLGLAIEPILTEQSTSSSPASFSNPLPPFPNLSARRFSNSADSQLSTTARTDAERPRAGDSLDALASGDYDHYLTTDDEDEGPSPPALEPIVPTLTAQSPSPSEFTPGPRPPKPTLPSRPSTSMGIPFPVSRSADSTTNFRRSPHRRTAGGARPPTPPSTLPTPPPEPPVAVTFGLVDREMNKV